MRLPGTLTLSMRQLGRLPNLHGLRPGHPTPVGRLDGQHCSALLQEAAPVAMHTCAALDDDGRPEAALAPGVCPRPHATDASLHPGGSPQHVGSFQRGVCMAVPRVAPVQHCECAAGMLGTQRHRCMAVTWTLSQELASSACSAHTRPHICIGPLAAPQEALNMPSGCAWSPAALRHARSAAWQCRAPCLRYSKQGFPSHLQLHNGCACAQEAPPDDEALDVTLDGDGRLVHHVRAHLVQHSHLPCPQEHLQQG